VEFAALLGFAEAQAPTPLAIDEQLRPFKSLSPEIRHALPVCLRGAVVESDVAAGRCRRRRREVERDPAEPVANGSANVAQAASLLNGLLASAAGIESWRRPDSVDYGHATTRMFLGR
jgi:hypothetical protein